MARDHLGVPATSVGPERVFSIGRDVVPYRRCHLKPEKIRELVMMRHYMKARANAAADEDDDEELDGEVRYESVAVRRDLGWAWSSDLISQGEGAAEENSEVLEGVEQTAGRSGSGRGVQGGDEHRVVHVDDGEGRRGRVEAGRRERVEEDEENESLPDVFEDGERDGSRGAAQPQAEEPAAACQMRMSKGSSVVSFSFTCFLTLLGFGELFDAVGFYKLAKTVVGWT